MGRLRRASWVAAGITIASAVIHSATAREAITVHVDQATVARMPEKVTTVVVGNPLIADVTIQAGGMMVVTGKGYGSTNVLALDRAGTVLMDAAIQVQGPSDSIMVVHRGIQRETYSCQPNCERRITLGDTPEYFNTTLTQTGVRNIQAQGGTAPAPR